jgi:hypothetical protein
MFDSRPLAHHAQALLQKTFRERRDLLRSHFKPYIPNGLGLARFAHVESVESEAGRDNVEDFWHRSIKSQTEGLMIKVSMSSSLFQVLTILFSSLIMPWSVKELARSPREKKLYRQRMNRTNVQRHG